MFYLNKILKALKEIYPAHAFKLVNINGEPHNKNIKITYQVSGKATIITEKSDVLLRELMHLKGFSKNDSDIIYNLNLKEKISPTLRISSIQFGEESTKFEIEDVQLGYTFLLAADDMINLDNMLKNFSHDDLTKIYYQLLQEKERFIKNTMKQFRLKSQYEKKAEMYLLKTSE